jgi:hypothetical protein
MMSSRTVYEKLDAAIRVLICNDISLHDRLDIAIAEVILLKEENLPPDFRKEFNQLIDTIHIYRDSENDSALQSNIALSIFEIFKKLVSSTGIVSKNKP